MVLVVRKNYLTWLQKLLWVGKGSDGYAAYRSYPKRQRCLAHLIRKAIAITGAINPKVAVIGQWILDDLRSLIAAVAKAGEKEVPFSGKTTCSQNLRLLFRQTS